MKACVNMLERSSKLCGDRLSIIRTVS